MEEEILELRHEREARDRGAIPQAAPFCPHFPIITSDGVFFFNFAPNWLL